MLFRGGMIYFAKQANAMLKKLCFEMRDVTKFNPEQDFLGGGGASKNKLKDTSFIFSTTNITVLSIFRTHALKEYCKVLETKGIYILNNFIILLFENL